MVLTARSWVSLGALVGGTVVLAVAVLLQTTWAVGIGLVLSLLGEVLLQSDQELRGMLTRSGFNPRVRMLARLLVVFGALGPVVDRELRAAFVLGGLALVAAGWLTRFVMQRAFVRTPPLPLRNLGAELSFPKVFERFRRLRADGPLAAYAMEFPLGLMLVMASAGVISSSAAALGVAILVVIVILAVLALVVSTLRYLRREPTTKLVRRLRQEVERFAPEVVAYFSGPANVHYWINQWLPALNRLERNVLIVAREEGNARQIGDTDWPIVLARGTSDVEVAAVESVKVALYFGNSGRNVHMLRYPQIKHAFLNHGDSDKATSATPVSRVYDRVFVAGEAGIERYHSAGVHIPHERFAIVGRPQLDGLHVGPRPEADERPTVLYAPTFEGFFDDINYSSLAAMGRSMIERLLQHPLQPRIIFKPHPYTGRVNHSFRAAKQRVEQLLRDAGHPHILADRRPEVDLFGWFDEADVLLADISSVVSDFLYTERPYLLTNPRGVSPERFRRLFPNHLGAYLVDRDLQGFEESLVSALGDDPRAEHRSDMAIYMLGDHPEGPQRSFQTAIDALCDEAVAHRATIRSTFSFSG